MKRPNPGSAIGVAGVLASVAAVWIAVAALEIPDHKDVWSNSWVLGGVGLAVIAVLIALYALFIPGQVEEQGQRAGQAVGGKMRLTFTEPALAVNGTARYSNLEKWLSNPLDSKNPTSFPVRGRVSPSPIGAEMRIRMRTDQWYDQSVSFIDGSGYFSGTVYINERRPQASMELTIVSADGIDLQTFYANLI